MSLFFHAGARAKKKKSPIKVLETNGETVGMEQKGKTFTAINAVEFLNGDFDLLAEAVCEQLEPEPEEGNMEYKLKLVGIAPERLEHLITQMNYRLKEGKGEAIYRIGVEDDGTPRGLNDTELRASIRTIHKMANELSSTVVILRVAQGHEGKMAELLVRKRMADYLDVRVCMIGNVDSGKSTLVGVLTTGVLDDGKGAARTGVLRHRHEIEIGHTSSISQQILGFDSKGDVTNYGGFRASAWEEIIEDSAKVLTLIDLAGHERYLKTTVFGLTAHIPDCSLVVVSAPSGVERMTRQHLGVSLALNIPLFVVVTKIDICPPEQLQNTIEQLSTILRADDIQKLPIVIKSQDQLTSCARNLGDRLITPIFLCSCVTGQGLDSLKHFLSLLPKHKDWSKAALHPSLFCVDQTFSVYGAGTVAAGMMLQGCIEAGDTLLLGPSDGGDFTPIRVKGIHIQRNPSKQAVAGQACSFAVKGVKRSQLRKGMVLVHPSRNPQAVVGFEATVVVLHHVTGIRVGYQPIVHIGTVRQAAKIVSIRPPPKNTTRLFGRQLRAALSRDPSRFTTEPHRRVRTPVHVPLSRSEAETMTSEDDGLAPPPTTRQRSSSAPRVLPQSYAPFIPDVSPDTRSDDEEEVEAERAHSQRSCVDASPSTSLMPWRGFPSPLVLPRAAVPSGELASLRELSGDNSAPLAPLLESPAALASVSVSASSASVSVSVSTSSTRCPSSLPAAASTPPERNPDLNQLITGDSAVVHFEFVHRPEFLTVGSKFIFRDSRTKGIGRVTKLYFKS